MKCIVLILSVLILIPSVEALAVASDYLEKNTLELVEGTSTIYSIRLQNPESYEVNIKLTYDTHFLKPLQEIKEEYILSPKSSTRIEFNVTAPKYSKNDNIFTIGFTVQQLTTEGGGLGFLPAISKQLKLKVIKSPNRLHINYFSLVYIAILIVILFFLFRKKKIQIEK